MFDLRSNIATINTSKLVFIFVNNLKVVRYNKSVGNLKGFQQIYLRFSSRIYNKVVPRHSEGLCPSQLEAIRVFNNFISDSLRESTINTSKLVFIIVNFSVMSARDNFKIEDFDISIIH